MERFARLPEDRIVFSSQLCLLSETQDHREAAQSSLEKRKPVFVGK
jgi:hypothetical protein